MKLKFLFCVFLLGFGVSSIAQNYIIYNVKPNDTPQSIALTNAISLEDLYKYNPDLKNKKLINQQKIVIPKTKNENFGLIRYRVKTKETLYSISRNFNLSIADIKAFNTQLYNNELRAGEVLNLPAYKLPKEYQKLDFNESIKNSNFTAFKHIVLPKERKSDILKKYDMSLQVFDSLNPNVVEVQSGQLVKVVPNHIESQAEEVKDLDMKLQFYRVPSKQTLYGLSKEFKVNEDIIYKLNPIIRREGLKANTIIKLPQQVEAVEQTEIVNLENYIQNFNEKKLALFLPFSLNQIKSDSTNPKGVLKKNNYLSTSLDIYAGVQWAIKHAKSKGISTDLKVYDSKSSSVNSILSENNLQDRDAIIGPILGSNIERLHLLKNNQTPIFLPITNAKVSSNLIFNTLPSQDLKTETLITYLDKTVYQKNKHHLIFITDGSANETFDKYKYTFPEASFFRISKSYVEIQELENYLKKNKINHVILDTDQIGISEGVVNNLYQLKKALYSNNKTTTDKENGIRLYTSNRNKAFREVINNEALCALEFTYISASKYDVLENNTLIDEFIRENNYAPSRYVLRAFDLTYDILLRLAYNGNLKSDNALEPLTEYNENRFGYSKPFLKKAYENIGVYIIKYKPNFEVEIVNLD